MELATYWQDKAELIEQQLDALVPEKEVPYNLLFKAARYSLMDGGKRFRPLLALATTEMLGGNLQHALRPACSLEMVHTYSLIHDDLPCMDDDDYRRGKPSLHKAFPEGQAVLAGDYLLTYAFEVIADCPFLSSSQKLKLTSTLARRSGGSGLIAGQVMDLEAEDHPVSPDFLKMIHENKTAALITASIEFGGIIAKASEKIMETLRGLGHDMGLAFQVVDDILDVTSSSEELGKPAGSDEGNHKSTFVSHFGLDKSKQIAKDLISSAREKLSSLPGEKDVLEGILDKIIHRRS